MKAIEEIMQSPSFTKYFKFIKFLFVGGLNAAIYFVILMLLINLLGNYYLSVGLGQLAIAAIGYVTFSRLHFKSELEFKIFFKFAASNIFLFAASSGLVWITSDMQLHPAVFGFLNVVFIAPLSYISNTYFVFKNAKLSGE